MLLAYSINSLVKSNPVSFHLGKFLFIKYNRSPFAQPRSQTSIKEFMSYNFFNY